jgi:hypothetical protein
VPNLVKSWGEGAWSDATWGGIPTANIIGWGSGTWGQNGWGGIVEAITPTGVEGTGSVGNVFIRLFLLTL